MKTADVVIVGGGIMGCSTAYHLAQKGCGVLLLEREGQLGLGSTGRSSGGFRHQFSHPLNVKLSIESIRKLENFEEEVGQTIDLHQDGYLFLLTSEKDRASFADSISMQHRLGVNSELLAPSELSRLIGNLNLNLKDVVAGAYCAQDGIADPYSVCAGYAKQARELGATFSRGSQVVGIRSEKGRVTGVSTADETIATTVVVNAAGPWAAAIGNLAKIVIPVKPSRRHVFLTSSFPSAPTNRLMVIDFATTFYFHREGDGVLMGMSDPREPSSFNQTVSWDFLDEVIRVAVKRYPPIASASIRRAWAGLYEISPDSNPILGTAPQLQGMYLANGFSGHGFMHGPIVGELLAELIVEGRSRIDITPFSLERFVDKSESTRESCVV